MLKKAAILIVFIPTLYSCRDLIELDCGEVYCDMVFHTFSVSVKYTDGTPVALDRYITIRDRLNKKIDKQSDLDEYALKAKRDLGSYPVLDDTHLDLIKYHDEKFIFKGYIGDKLVVKEEYVFTKSCCDFEYVSVARDVIIDK